MANKYTDILALVNKGNQMGLSNTIKRDYGIPLDFTSVQESYDAAIVYAATSTLAYVGQTVAVGGKLYIITDVAAAEKHAVGEVEYDNYLAEVGSKTEGDGNTIELDGQTLKLAGLTGLDNSKTYVPSLVNGKLVWAEPDTSTAEGQAQEINALKTRAAELEATVNGVEPAEGVEAKEGLVDKVAANAKAIADEIAARDAADKVLDGKIADALQAAKDYADENDADTIYNDEEVRGLISANVTAIEGLDERVEDVEGRVAELETAVEEVNSTIAGITHFTTKVVESVTAVTEVGVLYLIKDDSVEGVDKYNEYLFMDGNAVLIGDTTTDLSDYVTTEALNAAIADFVTSEGLASAIAGKADQNAVDEALALKADAADVVANDTFDTFKTANDRAIAAARTGAVSDVEAKGYAVAADVNEELAKKIENASIAHTTETQGEEVKLSEDGKTLNIFVDAYTKAETLKKIEEKITEINGGESAGEVLGALNSYKESNDLRVGAIETKNNDQDTAIAAAKAQADKGVEDAAAASAAVTALADGQVKTNKDDIDAVKGRLTTLETAKGDHETRISAAEGKIGSLETATANNASAIGALQGKDIELAAEDARLAGLIDGLTSGKANAADVYTKGEVDTKVQEAIDAIPEVDFTPYAKTEDVNAELAKKADAANVYTKEEADLAFMTQDEVDDRLNALINAADPEGGKVIGDIQNLVKFVEENAGDIAALVTATDANTAKLAGITTTVTDAIATAVASVVTPKESAEVSVSETGELGIKKVTLDKLEQGDTTLVIDGGTSRA